MKRNTTAAPDAQGATDALGDLAEVLSRMTDVDDLRAFLTDLCTPAELEAMTDRWRVVTPLVEGIPYRQIHELTGVSVTTVGRVARHLEHGAGGYAVALALDPTRQTSGRPAGNAG